jgi:hypothetical protein
VPGFHVPPLRGLRGCGFGAFMFRRCSLCNLAVVPKLNDLPRAATPALLFRGTSFRRRCGFNRTSFAWVATQKENRAGWPGFFCVELDAVTSQRGATGSEGMHLCASGRSQIERYGAASGNRLWAGCKRLAMHPFVSVGPATDCFHCSYEIVNLAHFGVPVKLAAISEQSFA